MVERRKGMLIVLSGPSGAGKGTLGEMLRAKDKKVVFSVSATTRKPRSGETDGVHYHFMTEERFEELVAQDAFVEYATVHGNRYGTLKSEVLERLERGQDVLLDIDTQGALQVMERMPDCVSVFILPQSFKELRARLTARNTEGQEEIDLRMRNARREVSEMNRYRYLIVNRTGHAAAAYRTLRQIVLSERQRSSRYFPEVEDDEK
ncbi:MAG: guanylate kinase [Clostridia bacterium]|nr:guanylate kinase [Clostridia bacterium]